MLKLVPGFAQAARVLKAKWFAPEMVEHVLDGLGKAGLDVVGGEEGAATRHPS
jgi:hypothetical protein